MKLHIYCLPQITNYFFIFNHPNYVRWLVPYHDNHDEFNISCFGIKINKKDFSRLPTDLTLEQIVDADTSSQKTGISYFTNSISARQRWAHIHFVRMEVLSEILTKLDMTTKDAVSQEIKPNQIMKNNRDSEKILKSLQENMHPFSEKVNKDLLFNIDNGEYRNCRIFLEYL